MTSSNLPGSSPGESSAAPGSKLPVRDWILLPMVGLCTMAFIAVGAKLIADKEFAHAQAGISSCINDKDPATGLRGVPNSVCLDKIPEGPLVEYRFNSCGDRAGMECGAKPQGTYRVVLVGSSYAMGFRVPSQDSFATQLPQVLSQRTHRPVELYNASMFGTGGTPHSIDNRFDAILANKPDLILWVIGSWEIDLKEGVEAEPVSAGGLRDMAGVREFINQTKVAAYLKHFLYQSRSIYLKSYLRGSLDAKFLLATPNSEVQQRLMSFNTDAADIISRARAAGVPLVATFIPNRAEASMISMDHWPTGYDPYKLDNELRSIVSSDGGTYVEILPDFRAIPSPEQYYFPIDTHLDAKGHSLITGMLANALTSGAVPALQSAAPAPTPSGQGN